MEVSKTGTPEKTVARILVFCLASLLFSPVLAFQNTEKLPGALDFDPKSIDNPHADGWNTEVLSEDAKKQLKKLVHILDHPNAMKADVFKGLLDPEFSTGPVRPDGLENVYEGGGIVVRRPKSLNGGQTYKGAEGLLQAMKALAAPYATAPEARAAVKLFRIKMEDGSFTTKSYVETHADLDDGSLQQNALWRCRWRVPQPGKKPKLMGISLEAYEETRVTNPKGMLFSEVTEAVLGANPSFKQQIAYGVNHWLTRLDGMLGLDFNAYQGLAVGDANGDGLDDVYICQNGGLPNRLYLQNPDGTATDVSERAGVDWLELTRSALFLDLDNDGDQDLVVAAKPQLLFLENDGRARFTLRNRISAGDDVYSITAADYDKDRDLDLYICNYRDQNDLSDVIPTPIPYHNANNGGRNRLLNNLGNWKFEDGTAAAGLDEQNTRFTFAASWEDFDNDGDLDLYVANDFGHNNLYRNDGGRFRDIAPEAGLTDSSFGMGVTWADVNRDGHMDVYVSNMFSAAGSRVTTQEKFKPNQNQASRARYQRLAKGNSLFLNNGDGSFKDISDEAAVTMGRWSWSSNFADLNNDGWEDIMVANGYITSYLTADL
ncbi:MAG: VCBS repeat-containing protein [Acidobacteriota bacterium]|nr:VCBS repeat-containing protein [Acidobacteriota bacterium]